MENNFHDGQTAPNMALPPAWMGWLIIAVAGVVRLSLLDSEGFWYDEIRSVTLSNQPWEGFWHTLVGEEVHPPLYFAVLKLWGGVFGWSESATRALSVVFSLVAVKGVCELGRILGNPEAGLLGGTYLAVSPMCLRYSLEARPYSALMAIVVLAVLSDFSWPDRNPRNRRGMAFWMVSNVALPFVHYSGGVFLLAKELCLLFSKAGPPFRRQLATLGIIAIFFLAWSPFLHEQAFHSPRWMIQHLSQPVSPFVAGMHFSLDPAGDFFAGLAGDLLGLATVGLFLLALRTSPVILGMPLAHILMVWIASFFLPLGQPRNLIGSLPIFSLGIGTALANLIPRKWLGWSGLVLLVAGVAVSSSSPYLSRPSFRPIADWVKGMEKGRTGSLPIVSATEEGRLGMSFYLPPRPIMRVFGPSSPDAPSTGSPAPSFPQEFVFVRHSFDGTAEAAILALNLGAASFSPSIAGSRMVGQTEGILLIKSP